MAPSQPSPSGRLPQLDGLRGIACLLVVFYHYLWPLAWKGDQPGYFWVAPLEPLFRFASLGWTGVDLFFVLSGFLIGGIILDYHNRERFLFIFYRRRTARILPLYFAWLSICLLMGQCDLSHSWHYPLFLQNFVAAWDNHHAPFWLAATWSLAVEEQFYLLLPPLYLVLPARFRARLVPLGIMLVAAIRNSLSHFPESDVATYVLLPCRGDALLLGVFGAQIVRNPWATAILRKRVLVLRLLSILFCLLMMKSAYGGYHEYAPAAKSFGYTLTAAGYLVILLTSLHDSWLSGILQNRTLRFFGSISYGVYVIHVGVLVLAHSLLTSQSVHRRMQEIAEVSDPLAVVIAFLATVSIAWLSFRWFEEPITNWGRAVPYGRVKNQPNSKL